MSAASSSAYYTDIHVRPQLAEEDLVSVERTLLNAEQCPIQNGQILPLMYGRIFASSVRIGIRLTILDLLPSA